MAWPVVINCTACSWKRELHEGDGNKQLNHFCPECGYRTKIKMDYKTPRQTKTDKI